MGENFSSFESRFISNEPEKVLFADVLSLLGKITPVFVSREEFSKKKGDILTKTGYHTSGNYYTLILPEDIQIHELVGIIRKVNTLSFGNNLPQHASSIELKIKLVKAVDILFQYKQIAPQEKVKEIEKQINKIYVTFQSMFPEEASQLGDGNYRQRMIDSGLRDERYGEYERKITQATSTSLQELEDIVGDDIKQHFVEAFFEDGIESLRKNMTSLNYDDMERVIKKIGDVKNTIIIGKDFSYEGRLESEKIAAKIGMEKLKSRLSGVRRTGDKEAIEKEELQVANELIKALHKEFPYQDTPENRGFTPSGMLVSGEMYCVGFSLLSHTFLQDLSIPHKALKMPSHSALYVTIGGKNFYFDATNYSEVYEFSFGEIPRDTYKQLIPKVEGSLKDLKGISGNAETLLLQTIIWNKISTLSKGNKPEEVIKLITLAKSLGVLPIRYEAPLWLAYNSLLSKIVAEKNAKEIYKLFLSMPKELSIGDEQSYVELYERAVDSLCEFKNHNYAFELVKSLKGKIEDSEIDRLQKKVEQSIIRDKIFM